ncbi:LOW QUALITY PROTEIN: Gag protein, partial [Phytophthora palmivora]
MDAALHSSERLRVAFALSNLEDRAKTWPYTREATTLGCFTTWAQLSAFLPANYEYRQRSHFLVCKQGKRELNEYIQEMRVLAASLVGNPLPEHIRVTVFMDGLKVGPSRTQLFCVQTNTTEEAIQIALQEEYSRRQARTPTSATMRRQAQCKELQQLELTPGRYPWNWVRRTELHPLLRMWEARAHASACPAGGQKKFPSKPKGLAGQLQKPRSKSQGNWGHQSADGARHGGLAPESLGALETRKSSSGLLVVHASVRGYGDPFRVLIDSGASTLFVRGQMVARNGDKYADDLRKSKGRGQVSVRLADGTVVNVPGVRVDLAVKFEDFDSTESFLVLDMDKYDLILGM